VPLNRYSLFLPGILLALAALWLLRPDEEHRILGRLERLRAAGEIAAPESGIDLLARSAEIGDFFDAHTVFDLSHAGHGRIEIDSRDELIQRIIRIRARLATLQLTLQDPRVHIADGTAEVVLTGSGRGHLRGERDPFLEIHTVAVSLRREADDWIVTGATHLRDERQPPPAQSD
jgi:hypothetical protein